MYRTKASAKEDLLWYLATKNNHASRWIRDKFPKELWTVLSNHKQSTNERDNTLRNINNADVNAFLLLTLVNRPSKNTNGNIFCSLMYVGNGSTDMAVCKKGCVLASFNDGTNRELVFPLIAGSILLHDRPITIAPVQKETFREKVITTPEESVTTGTTKPVESITTSPKRKRHSKEGEPRQPIQFDVFISMQQRSSSYKDIPKTEYPALMEKWRPYWLDSLKTWRSLFVPRGGQSRQGDTYWYPPGATNQQRYIRSGEDLRLYLDFCCKHSDSSCSQVELLLQWKNELKLGKEIERNKKGGNGRKRKR